MYVDLPVLIVGALLIVALSLVCVLPSAWRHARGDSARSPKSARTSASRLGGLAVRLGLPVSAGVGVRLAVEPGRGRTAVPVRAALVTVTVAVAAITGAYVFGASLTALTHTPSTYGWTWDVAIGNPNGGFQQVGAASDTNKVEQRLRSDTHVAALTGISFADATVGHAHVRTMGVDTTNGVALPSLIAGRHPEADNEVAMTATALRDTKLQHR